MTGIPGPHDKRSITIQAMPRKTFQVQLSLDRTRALTGKTCVEWGAAAHTHIRNARILLKADEGPDGASLDECDDPARHWIIGMSTVAVRQTAVAGRALYRLTA